MDSCASKIIKEMSVLNSSDDGIKANQKYKYILTIFQKECTTAKHLREIYQCLNEQSLKDPEFAQKFAMLSSCRLFQTLELFGQKAKSLMMAVMKDNYENLDTIKDTNLDGFYNSITLFGEYYNRARMTDGSPLSGLVIPLIEYFKVMLQLNTERSATEFATQITLNGELMFKTHPDEIADLMLLVRRQMLSKNIENDSARIWLMLCMDLSHNQFHIIDAKLEKFYNEMLMAAESNKCSNRTLNTENDVEPEHDKANVESHVKKEESVKVECESLQNVQKDDLVKDTMENTKESYNLTNTQNSNPALTNNTQLPRPTRFSINQNIPQSTNSNLARNTSNHVSRQSSQNLEKSALSDTWGPDDTTSKNFSNYRNRSAGKASPTRQEYSRNKSFSSENFTGSFMKRNPSPQRFDTRSCHNIVMKTVQSNLQSDLQKLGPKLLSPRERVQKVVSPHQALVEKAQRLSLLTEKNKSSIRNDLPDTHNNLNSTTLQNKKATKAYLQDHNVENLTWNNSDYCKDFYPEKNDMSPRFMNYLQRN